MEKKLIVRIAEGLGNQLFMYANSYALSKELDYNMYVDDKSGTEEVQYTQHTETSGNNYIYYGQ